MFQIKLNIISVIFCLGIALCLESSAKANNTNSSTPCAETNEPDCNSNCTCDSGSYCDDDGSCYAHGSGTVIVEEEKEENPTHTYHNTTNNTDPLGSGVPDGGGKEADSDDDDNTQANGKEEETPPDCLMSQKYEGWCMNATGNDSDMVASCDIFADCMCGTESMDEATKFVEQLTCVQTACENYSQQAFSIIEQKKELAAQTAYNDLVIKYGAPLRNFAVEQGWTRIDNLLEGIGDKIIGQYNEAFGPTEKERNDAAKASGSCSEALTGHVTSE